jgi:hypothetical protein
VPSRQESRPNRRRTADTAATTTNTALNRSAGAKRATTAPSATPSTTGTAQIRTMDMSTGPWRRCALKERMEVGMMTARDVPTQSGIRASSGTPTARNSS